MATAYADREVTHPPDWHGLVVWDFLLNAVTTGLFLVAAVCHLLRPELFGPAARWAYPVALLVLAVDLVCLVWDLGHPTRFHHMLRVVKPSSPMSLGTWCLTAYSLPLTVAAALTLLPAAGLLAGDWSGWQLLAAAVGILPAFGALGYKGVLFSTSSQPGWRDARWLGGYHAASAVSLGAGGLLLLAQWAGPAAAVGPLRTAVVASALLAAAPLLLLLRELGPAIDANYPRWAWQMLALPMLSWASVLVLVMSAERWADVAAFGALAASTYTVRSVVVHLPHRVAGHRPADSAPQLRH